jgi:hypothetical protein
MENETETQNMELIDGLAYLLMTDSDGFEAVVRYNHEEVMELFSPAERDALGRGQEVIRLSKHGGIRWVDMIAAARAVR